MRKFCSYALVLCFCSFAAKADTSQHYESALVAYNDGQYQEAYIHLKNSLKDDPNNLAAKILMGKLLLRNTYLEEAELELYEALELGGDINLILEPLGNSLILQRKYEEILDLKFSGRPTEETQFKWLLFTATANFKTDKIESARRDYYSAVDLFPSNMRALNELVSLELTQERYAEAKVLIDKAISIDDQNPRIWQLLGKYHRVQWQLPEAEEALTKANKLSPNDPSIMRSLADIYVNTKDRDNARVLVRQILQQTPDDPMAMLLNSWLLSESNESEQAVDELTRLSSTLANFDAQAFDKEPTLLYIGAISAFAQNKFEQARENFEQYLLKEPGNLQASAMLARTYIKLNNSKLALETLEPYARSIASDLEAAVLLGELYLKNNKAFKAVALLGRLSSEYPDDKRVLLLNVKTLGARGKVDEAIAKIDESGYQNNDITFILTKSMLLLNQGKTDEANYVADRLLDIDPENYEFINLKGAVLIKLKQWQEAEPYIDKVLSVRPNDYSARFNKATILGAREDFLGANEILVELSQISSNNVPTLLMLAKTQQQLNQIEPAIDNLNRVLELDFNNIAASELLVSLYANSGEFEKAIRMLNALSKKDALNPVYMFQKAALYANKQDLDNAQRQFRNIERVAAEDPRLIQELSNLRFRVGDREGAKKSITQAVDLAPDNLGIGLSYVKIHITTGDLTLAEQKLQQLKKKHTKVPTLLVTEGDLYSTKEEYEKAAEVYLQALIYAPKFRLALNSLYQITLKNKGLDVFEEGVGKLVRRYPSDHYQRNLFADFLMNIGKPQEALKQYKRLADVPNFPNKIFVYNNMANIYMDSDLALAEEFINKAIALKQDNSAVLDTHGWIKAQTGKLEEALLILRQAYAMNSKDPGIRYHLGYTLHKLGRDEEAKEELVAALESDDIFQERDNAEQLLNSI